MRSIILGVMVATGMSVFAISAASAAPLARDAIAGQGVIEQVQYESRYCRRLRRACRTKTFGAKPVRATAACIVASAEVADADLRLLQARPNRGAPLS